MDVTPESRLSIRPEFQPRYGQFGHVMMIVTADDEAVFTPALMVIASVHKR